MLHGAGTSNSTSTTGIATLSGTKPTDNLEPELKRGTREAWYYRRARAAAAGAG